MEAAKPLFAKVAAAHADPGPHARAYQERFRVENDAKRARRLYAEALRRSGEGR